jgi:antitoxin VapB
MQTTKLILDGENQTVSLPKEFQFSGREVLIKRMGSAVILLPKGTTWGEHLQEVTGFGLDFLKERTPPKKRARASAK